MAAAGNVPVDAIVHRVVHGGTDHANAELIDDRLLTELAELVPLAPLHQPPALDGIALSRRLWPDLPEIACYDTAFHRRAAPGSDRLPVPDRLDALGMRRYGFHGLSLQSVVDRLPARHQAVVAHLGGGCSVTAIADGRPRFTTMSVTPAGGIFSGSRSGDLDPDAVLALIDNFGYTVAELRHVINLESGLSALSGGIADHRELISAARTSVRAAQALDAFIGSVAMAVLAAATTLDCWDRLVFTGGIGERAGSTREAICRLAARTRGRTVADRQIFNDRRAMMDDRAPAFDAAGSAPFDEISYLIVVESEFGNTRTVADAIAEGLAERVQVLDVDHAPRALPAGLRLLIVGAPTHAFGLSTIATRAEAVREGGRNPGVCGIGSWASGENADQEGTAGGRATTELLCVCGQRSTRRR